MDRVSVLDHGYVELVETWGSDESIICAARMSTGKGFQGWGDDSVCRYGGITHRDTVCKRGMHGCYVDHKIGDEKLLKYLWLNQHATPFEMAGAIVEVQAPIFVFREWHRHRVQAFNEMSARYTPLPDVNYVPTVERLMINAGASNKQAGTIKGANELAEGVAEHFRSEIRDVYVRQQHLYEWALGAGVPKELARIHLPVGRYSRMRASANLRNWLAFLTLRMAPNAQWEIQQFANAVSTIIASNFPRTHELFMAGFTAEQARG